MPYPNNGSPNTPQENRPKIIATYTENSYTVTVYEPRYGIGHIGYYGSLRGLRHD